MVNVNHQMLMRDSSCISFLCNALVGDTNHQGNARLLLISSCTISPKTMAAYQAQSSVHKVLYVYIVSVNKVDEGKKRPKVSVASQGIKKAPCPQ